MTYQDIMEQARGTMGAYCKVCPVCNGRACKNQLPGPGAKGVGDTAMRNYEKWQEIRVNMDTISENRPVDTSLFPVWKNISVSVFCRTGRCGESALW